MHNLKSALNLSLLLALWAGCCVLLGAAFRVASWLFCLGYGC
jgi:hypothetical protein